MGCGSSTAAEGQNAAAAPRVKVESSSTRLPVSEAVAIDNAGNSFSIPNLDAQGSFGGSSTAPSTSDGKIELQDQPTTKSKEERKSTNLLPSSTEAGAVKVRRPSEGAAVVAGTSKAAPSKPSVEEPQEAAEKAAEVVEAANVPQAPAGAVERGEEMAMNEPSFIDMAALPLVVALPGDEHKQIDDPASKKADLDLDDPWASLQQQFKMHGIDDEDDPIFGSRAQHASAQNTVVRTSAPAFKNRFSSSSTYRADDVLVLKADEEEEEEVLGGATFGSISSPISKVPPRVQPPPPSQGPRAGGWGNGDMAKAGTLMVGEDILAQSLAQPNLLGPGYEDLMDLDLPESMDPPGPAEEHVAPLVQEHIGLEDVDDLDALVEQELQHAGLAAKLMGGK